MIQKRCRLARRPRRRAVLCGVILLAMAGAPGCVSYRRERPPAGDAAPPLELPDAGPWRVFEVRRHGFARRRVEFRELGSPRVWTVTYKGRPSSWFSPINLLVDEDAYERRSHRARFRFTHPLSGRRIVLRVRSRSHSIANVPLVPHPGTPAFEVLDENERWLGHLGYDAHSLVLLAGQLEGHRVEIEQVNAGAARAEGPIEYVLNPCPATGEFVVRSEGREVARFAKARERGTVCWYTLAVRANLAPLESADPLLAFIAFDLMKDFVRASVH
jgi:hypothetical protein